MADETPQVTAPAEQAGQPVPQAVENVQAVPASTEQAAAPAQADTAAPVAEKLYAGKYKSPEILEESYLHAQAENSRMAQELATLRKQAVPVANSAADPFQGYTKQNWEALKEQRLTEALDAAASGDAKAAKDAAHQVTMIDAKIREVEYEQNSAKSTQQTELQSLSQEIAPVLEKYKADLTPGQPVHTLAEQLYQRALKAGAPDNLFTANWAVSQALLKSGKLGAVDSVKASESASKSLNQALKGAAAAGSGAANANAAPPLDFKAMSNKDFAAYRKSQGVGK